MIPLERFKSPHDESPSPAIETREDRNLALESVEMKLRWMEWRESTGVPLSPRAQKRIGDAIAEWDASHSAKCVTTLINGERVEMTWAEAIEKFGAR